MKDKKNYIKVHKSTELAYRQSLRDRLEYGDIKLLTEMAGVSKNVVSRYLQGEYKRSKVAPYLEAFAERLEHRKAIIEREIDAAFIIRQNKKRYKR